MSSTIRVELAEVPRDVLVRLVDQGPEPLGNIVDAVRPEDVDPVDAWIAVERALGLLRDMGVAEQRRRDQPGGGVCWFPTDEGRALVADARAAASPTEPPEVSA